MSFEKILDFKIKLENNNSKEWFVENKHDYEVIKQDVISFTSLIINGIRNFDNEITNINPKDCLFRINRDIRFSNNKMPYKTNLGIFF